ncbi:MAG: L-rhamnose isomerase [Alistipes indistinctus]
MDRYLYRSLLKDSLDKIFATKCPNVKDAVECKLFGTGLESFTVGSHEFYMEACGEKRNHGYPRHGPLPSDRRDL